MSCLYPSIKPYREAKLQVSPLHTLHYQEVGNPNGQAALFLHGGPGVGILPDYRRFFDPEHYRLVLLDQRGAGRSTPHAELEENNTWTLVEDIEKLRKHLGINAWVLMGGSWGSLLALCYAIKYSEQVSAMILRGVFLGRQKDLDWVYRGVGTAQIFPEEWFRFCQLVAHTSEQDNLSAYYQLLTSNDKNMALDAAYAWARWSTTTMTLLPNKTAVDEIVNDQGVLPVSRLECHYANHDFFLPEEDFILKHCGAIKDIPTHIVQGRYDAICAANGAWELSRVLNNVVLEIIDKGGHSPMEQDMARALVKASDKFKQ